MSLTKWDVVDLMFPFFSPVVACNVAIVSVDSLNDHLAKMLRG